MTAIVAAATPPAPVAVLPTTAIGGIGTSIRAVVGGSPRRFLFDTGAGVTSVTPALAHAAGCVPWGNVTGFRATGERLDLPRCDGLRFAIGSIALVAPTATVLDIDAVAGEKLGVAGVVGLDLFAGRTITIRPRAHQIVVESPASLRARVARARPEPIRIVRDAEGVALSVDAAVPTSRGTAWLELDTGNLGPTLVDARIAPLLGLTLARGPQPARFRLANGDAIAGPAIVETLVLDGDIGASYLRDVDLTLDLADGRAWIAPASA